MSKPLRGAPYRLGIDLGSNSLGWSVLRLNEDGDPDYLLRLGVRIFSSGRKPKNGESLAVDRRNARQQRRRRDRMLRRKRRLLDALRSAGLFPSDRAQGVALKSLNPYELRLKGLTERLEPFEIGRAIFHLNQRRGFRSNRRADRGEQEELGKIASAVSALKAKLQETGSETVGAYLHSRLVAGRGTRARRSGEGLKAIYDFYPDRSMTEHEFGLLWERQKPFHPETCTEARREQIRGILLFQRPLRPVQAGRCSLDPSQTRSPLALPSVESCRIWQEVNNLKIYRPEVGRVEELSAEQRSRLAELLLNRAVVTFAGIRRELRLPSRTAFNLEGIKRDKLLGNRVGAELSRPEAAGDIWRGLSLERQDELVQVLMDDALTDAAALERLRVEFGLTEAGAQAALNAKLVPGYSRLSLCSIRRLLPHLREGMTYDKAVTAAGFSATSTDAQGEAPDLPYYGEALQRHVAFGSGDPADGPEVRFGRISNPSVHIALNELRKVVNALVRRYGKPTEVSLELTRDIKLGWEKAREVEREQKKRQEENDGIKEALAAMNEPITPDNILKMRLFGELLGSDGLATQCVYSGEQISIQNLLSSEVEVDHILPFSRTLDDSVANKVLCVTRANRIKGNQSPFEAFGHSPSGFNWEDIVARAATLPRRRARRFTEEAMADVAEGGGFLARQLNDTAYMSRLAREYFSHIVAPQRICVVTGRLTGMLRGKWGLNHLLGDDGKKNRLDQRHHAIDATVIACIDRKLVMRVAQAAERAQQEGARRLVSVLALPWPTFLPGMENAMQRVVVSYRPDHSTAGALHNDTAYGAADGGQLASRGAELYGRVRHYVPLLSLVGTSPEDIRAGVVDLAIGDALAKLAQVHQGNKPATRTAFEEFGRQRGVRRLRWQETLTVIPIRRRGDEAPYKYAKPDGNYCMEIYRDEKGKWADQLITRYAANRPDYMAFTASAEYRNRAFNGAALVMRLLVDDTVLLRREERNEIYRVQRLTKGEVTLAHQFAQGDPTRNAFDLGSVKASLRVSPNALRTLNARRVFVDVIGRVFDPGGSDGRSSS